MALAFVQRYPDALAPYFSGASLDIDLAFDSAVGTNSLLIATCHIYQAGTAPAVTFSDNKGNSWQTDEVRNANTVVTHSITIGSAIATTGGSGLIVKCTSGSGTCLWTAGAYEFSDPILTSWKDSSTGAVGNSTAINSGAVSPSGNCVYVSSWCMDGYVNSNEPGAPWTTRHHFDETGNLTISVITQIGTGSKSGAWTLDGARQWGAVIAAYKEAVGGPTGNPTYYYNLGRGQ